MKLAFKLPICAVGAAALSLAGAVAGSRWISATESQAATATVAAVPASGDAGAHMPPGVPHWGLPPPNIPMIWQGLTDAQICRSLKNPKENKNRNIDQLVEHFTKDELVAWGWNPGEGRNPIPMPRDEFVAKVKQWQAAGAPCPSDTAQKAKS